jgi:hypothetical protein
VCIPLQRISTAVRRLLLSGSESFRGEEKEPLRKGQSDRSVLPNHRQDPPIFFLNKIYIIDSNPKLLKEEGYICKDMHTVITVECTTIIWIVLCRNGVCIQDPVQYAPKSPSFLFKVSIQVHQEDNIANHLIIIKCLEFHSELIFFGAGTSKICVDPRQLFW